ncbi:O-antigen ligase family protein [Elioraea sp.]|uniref:O-antigen ligase family protein n=1 Tax=Elioraea sp. TaxID=2185103 RepID=UPI003F718BC1
MSGWALGAALGALPTAVAMQSRAATPILVVTALALVWAERARLAAVMRGTVALWPVGLLAGWGIASATWSIAPDVSLGGAVRFAALVGLGALVVGAAGLLDTVSRRRAGRGLILGVAAASAVLIVEVLTGGVLGNAVRLFPEPPRRVDGIKPGASVLVLLLPPAIVLCWREAGRVAALCLAAAGALAVLAAPSEAARLALLAGAAGAAVALAPYRTVCRLGPLLLALLVLAGPSVLQATGEAAGRAGLLPPSGLHRVAIWDFVAARAAERPVLGWGFETSRVMPGGQARVADATFDRLAAPGPTRDVLAAMPDQFVQNLPLHPHNGGLQVRLELGMIGLLLAAVGAWWIGRGIVRAPTPVAIAAGAGTAASGLVVALVAFGVWQAWWVGSLILAATAWRVCAEQR